MNCVGSSGMQRKTLPPILALAAVLAAFAGNFVICWQGWQFYESVSALPPGSEIRLIGRGIDNLLVSSVTLIVTIPFSFAGLVLSIKQRRTRTGLASVIAAVFALTPLPLAYWLDGRIIAATGVALAP